MTRKIMAISMACALVFAVAFVATGGQNARACNKGAKASNASAKTCPHATSASARACNRGASASAATCCKGARASDASARACNKGAKASNASAKTCPHATSASARACNRGASASAAGCCARNTAAATTAALKSIIDEVPFRKNKRIVLNGSMECGRCTYHKTASCTPLFKTADGKVYPLMDNRMCNKMENLHASTYRVTSRVTVSNGIKYLDVKAFQAL